MAFNIISDCLWPIHVVDKSRSSLKVWPVRSWPPRAKAKMKLEFWDPPFAEKFMGETSSPKALLIVGLEKKTKKHKPRINHWSKRIKGSSWAERTKKKCLESHVAMMLLEATSWRIVVASKETSTITTYIYHTNVDDSTARTSWVWGLNRTKTWLLSQFLEHLTVLGPMMNSMICCQGLVGQSELHNTHPWRGNGPTTRCDAVQQTSIKVDHATTTWLHTL